MTANIADTSPKWYVFDTVTPRYELREGAIVLAEVKYMRPECVWGTKNRIGFGHHHAAMRWEEALLNLPQCPIVRWKP